MTLPASSTSLDVALSQIQNLANSVKQHGNGAIAIMQANSVNTAFIFNVVNQLNSLITSLNSLSGTAGLNAYATAQLPGYAGTLTTDITATVNAATACVSWISTNFPNSNGWLNAEKLNADGSFTYASFTPAQTAGFVTLLQALIATIG